MNGLPVWAALAVAFLVLFGAVFTLIGTYGLFRLGSFYSRVHAPTLGTSFGVASITLASMLYFSFVQARPLVHELLIIIFVTVTTPVTLMLLTRAALYRDRSEQNDGVPGQRHDDEDVEAETE